MPILISAIFLGLLGFMSIPYLVVFKNVTGIITIIVAGATVIMFNNIGKKIKIVKEFAFAGSMITGMVFAAYRIRRKRQLKKHIDWKDVGKINV